jgi:hypothetical protein
MGEPSNAKLYTIGVAVLMAVVDVVVDDNDDADDDAYKRSASLDIVASTSVPAWKEEGRRVAAAVVLVAQAAC